MKQCVEQSSFLYLNIFTLTEISEDGDSCMFPLCPISVPVVLSRASAGFTVLYWGQFAGSWWLSFRKALGENSAVWQASVMPLGYTTDIPILLHYPPHAPRSLSKSSPTDRLAFAWNPENLGKLCCSDKNDDVPKMFVACLWWWDGGFAKWKCLPIIYLPCKVYTVFKHSFQSHNFFFIILLYIFLTDAVFLLLIIFIRSFYL